MRSKSITGKEWLLEWQSVAYTCLKLDLNIDIGSAVSSVVPLNTCTQSLRCNQTCLEYQDFARKQGTAEC